MPKGNQVIQIAIDKNQSSNSDQWNNPQLRPIGDNLPAQPQIEPHRKWLLRVECNGINIQKPYPERGYGG